MARTPSEVSMLIRLDMEPFIASLHQLSATFETMSAYLEPFGRLGPSKPVRRAVARSWCDRHVIDLNYGLLASLYVLAATLIWLLHG